MKIVGYGVAALGTAYVVKQVRRRKESSRGWHKIKVEEKTAGATAPHETQVKEEKRMVLTRSVTNPTIEI